MKLNTKVILLITLYIAFVLIAPSECVQRRHRRHLKHNNHHKALQQNAVEDQGMMEQEAELQESLEYENNNTTVANNATNSTNATNKTNTSNQSNVSKAVPVPVPVKNQSSAQQNQSIASSAAVQKLAAQNERVVAQVQVSAKVQAPASNSNKQDQAVKQILDKLEQSNQHVQQIKKTTITVSEKQTLPTTPKGLQLNNHFGVDPRESPYGPQPVLLRQEAWVNSSNGTLQKTIITKVIQTSQDSQGCDISSFANFQLCLEFTDCDLCAAAPQCGWCSTTNRCLPGTLKQAACTSACTKKGWNFNVTSCKRNVRSGQIKMSPDATKIITAEITQPKARVETVITHQAVVKTPVLLGTKKYRTQSTQVDTNGNVVGKQDVDIVKPIVGEIHQVLNVDTHHQQYVDIKSGKRLDKQDVETFHGKDGY